MKCNICGCELEGYGNNPFPLCKEDDYESRCCDVCNMMVIQARIAKMQADDKEPEEGDLIILFWCSKTTQATDTIKNNGKFLAGHIEKIVEKEGKRFAIGSWGHGIVCLDDDSYAILKED